MRVVYFCVTLNKMDTGKLAYRLFFTQIYNKSTIKKKSIKIDRYVVFYENMFIFMGVKIIWVFNKFCLIFVVS